jgi:hypothetical protein
MQRERLGQMLDEPAIGQRQRLVAEGAEHFGFHIRMYPGRLRRHVDSLGCDNVFTRPGRSSAPPLPAIHRAAQRCQSDQRRQDQPALLWPQQEPDERQCRANSSTGLP